MSATIKGAATELGTERIRKLLMQYAVPAIIAMTASSLYNMVDSIFIGHGVGPLAISGLALTFPLMNLAAAFGSLVGVGAATLISMRLGQRDYETAQRVLGNVLVLNLIIGIAFGLAALLFLALRRPAALFRWEHDFPIRQIVDIVPNPQMRTETGLSLRPLQNIIALI